MQHFEIIFHKILNELQGALHPLLSHKIPKRIAIYSRDLWPQKFNIFSNFSKTKYNFF